MLEFGGRDAVFADDFGLEQPDDGLDRRGIDRDGCIVVRPDQHIALVLPINARTEPAAHFTRFTIARG